ncbi:MAG: hypothetical protein AB7O97_10380 [Planctomycetota bacterium]
MWKPKAPTTGGNSGTVSVEREHALPFAEAMELVVANDRRPLLVLRECERCKGTDHALLSRSLDNEQTTLLTHWFHCIKLPTNVLEADHPLTALFKPEKEGDRVPHLFFCDPDGSNKAPLPGDQSQSELWDTMFQYLDRCYEGNAKKALKEMRRLLNEFDKIDSRMTEIRGAIDREIEKRGPESKKLEKLEKQLAKLEEEREELFVREKEIRDLALIELATPTVEAEGSDASGAGAR